MGKNKKTKKSHSVNRTNSKIKIENKNLSINDVKSKYTDEILKEKECCKKDIIKDSISCLLLIFLDVFLFFCFFGNKFDMVVAGAMIVFATIAYITWNLLKSIPSRIYNYKNFNLEKSQYATITNKYDSTYKDLYGNVNKSYYFDLKLNNTKKLIKKYVGYDKYSNLKVGGKVIVASFDKYNTYVVEI